MYTALGTSHHWGVDAALRTEKLKLGIELISKLDPGIPRQVRLPAITKRLDEFREPDALSIS